ncbi:MAG: cadmium-translocating P-type ATPase [Trueperaceae bacterium]|nr:cadmium-translocating P-type ATPase [Trueperaceae bacterium]
MDGAVVTQAAPRIPIKRAPSRFGIPLALWPSVIAGVALLVGWLGELTGLLPAPLPLLAYLISYVAGGKNAVVRAFKAARRGRFDIDLLMVVAALGAAALGDFAEGALLLFLFSAAHALEHLAMDRARDAIRALADLSPDEALVRRDGLEVLIPSAELVVGDVVVVRPGERLPADGEVLEGQSHVDQAPITGESVPVEKGPGAAVFAGTINGSGPLVLKTTRPPHDTTLARVVRLVEEARKSQAPTHRFAQRFTRVLTPVVIVGALIVIFVPPLFGMEQAESFRRAMLLLVAASPCALALSTPSAVLAGIARAARSGVLIKGGAYLERAGAARVVVLDKTGTLTEGTPRLTDIWAPEGSDADPLLATAAAAERLSAHPLAAAVVQAAAQRGLDLPDAEDVQSLTGRGLSATVAGREVLIGSPALMAERGVPVSAAAHERRAALEADGKSVVSVAEDGVLLGMLALRDEPRAGAAGLIRSLKDLGVARVVLLSGDQRAVAESIGRAVGVDDVIAEALPETKAEVVRELQSRHGAVVMVGDGVNDAPALALADVGVAMGGAGTDVALETADMVLMADDLARLPYAIGLSRAARRTIVTNLVISLGVMLLLIPSVLLGVAGMAVAVVLHEGSTLVVIANALRLLGYRGPKSSEALR